MDEQKTQPVTAKLTSDQTKDAGRPDYQPPTVTVMDETEVLKAFQFTSAAISWWVA